ncbi:hypothetical protein GCM10010429_07400 [Micromonospora olivasterospora]
MGAMTDGITGGETYPGEPATDGPGRLTKALGAGLAVALLATIGATGGWLLAGDEGTPPAPPDAGAGARVTPSEASPPTVRTPAPTHRTSAPAQASGLTVPPVVGTDFEDARDELRDRRLGWRLVFGTGTGRQVARSTPPPGAPVSRGTTVTLYVAGPAPTLTVPDLLGDDCDDAADELVDEGFYPRYRTGRKGTVTAQHPGPDTPASWNDEVALTCGDEPSDPTGEPTPTP